MATLPGIDTLSRSQSDHLVCLVIIRDGNLGPAMGNRNQEVMGLSYRPASLCSLATQCQSRFLELIPCPLAGLEFPTQAALSAAFLLFCK
jgi:hypothetical protein